MDKMDNSNQQPTYGYQNGYGSGSSDTVDVSASTTPTYGYQSGYAQQPSGISKLDLAKAAMSQVEQLAPWNKANQAVKDIGGEVAQVGGYIGGKVANAGYPATGNAIQAGGVGLGGAIALSPDLLAAYTGMKGIYNSPNPTVQGLVNTPQELGPQYAAQNQAIGISNDVPETASKVVNPDPYQYPSTLTKPKYVNGIAGQVEGAPTISRLKPQVPAEPLPSTTPLKYPDDPGTLINQINDRISTHGTNLNPQELSDYKNLLQTKMANGDIPKFDPNGKVTSIFAQASQANKNITNTLNQVAEPLLQNAQLPEGTIPTRSGLNQAYGTASKQQNIQNFLQKWGIRAGELGIASTGAKGIYDWLKK